MSRYCKTCGASNDSSRTCCYVCDSSLSDASSVPVITPTPLWMCHVCTLNNSPFTLVCVACSTARVAVPPAASPAPVHVPLLGRLNRTGRSAARRRDVALLAKLVDGCFGRTVQCHKFLPFVLRVFRQRLNGNRLTSRQSESLLSTLVEMMHLK